MATPQLYTPPAGPTVGIQDPEAIQRAAVTSGLQTDQPYQQAVQGQQGAISALDQLKEYDKNLAGQYQQNNATQGQYDATRRAATSQMGVVNPSSAGATIALGPSSFDSSTIQPVTSGLLSPFVASSIASGQGRADTDVYSLASQMRGSREKLIGTDAEAAAKKAETDNQRAQDEFERQFKLISLTGGTIFNPFDGKFYKVPGPKSASTGTFDIATALKGLRTPEATGSTTGGAAATPKPSLESFYTQPNAISTLGSSPQGGSATLNK